MMEKQARFWVPGYFMGLPYALEYPPLDLFHAKEK